MLVAAVIFFKVSIRNFTTECAANAEEIGFKQFCPRLGSKYAVTVCTCARVSPASTYLPVFSAILLSFGPWSRCHSCDL